MDRSVALCLERLTPHLDRRRVALTGGVAIALHLDLPARPTHDVDFVADTLDAVAPTVVEDFLVSHVHLPQPGYAKFLLQLVDPRSRRCVDVFPDSLGALPRARWHALADASLLVLDPRAILEHKRALLAAASPDAPVEEKHYDDARALAILCGTRLPERPASGFAPAAYSQDLDAVCARCAASADPRFPLAPKHLVHDLLGHV